MESNNPLPLPHPPTKNSTQNPPKRERERQKERKTYSLLIPKNLPNIHETPLNLRHGSSLERDGRRSVEPIALHLEFGWGIGGVVFEVDGGF
jgi:hypothetical protein